MPATFYFLKIGKEANAQALNELKNAEESKAFKIKQETEAAQASADKINGKSVSILAKAGQGGKLFGSVTAKERLRKQLRNNTVLMLTNAKLIPKGI